MDVIRDKAIADNNCPLTNLIIRLLYDFSALQFNYIIVEIKDRWNRLQN